MSKIRTYWLKHYCNGHCVLCGNTGTVDTTKSAKTPSDELVGVRTFCFCPNGRAMRKKREKGNAE